MEFEPTGEPAAARCNHESDVARGDRTRICDVRYVVPESSSPMEKARHRLVSEMLNANETGALLMSATPDVHVDGNVAPALTANEPTRNRG